MLVHDNLITGNRTGIDVMKLWYSLVVRRDHLKAVQPALHDTNAG